ERVRRKTYLIAFLDDATRVVPYCAFALSENTQAFLPVFKQALVRRGLPARLYVDNGANYRSHHLALVCAKSSVSRSSTRVPIINLKEKGSSNAGSGPYARSSSRRSPPPTPPHSKHSTVGWGLGPKANITTARIEGSTARRRSSVGRKALVTCAIPRLASTLMSSSSSRRSAACKKIAP